MADFKFFHAQKQKAQDAEKIPEVVAAAEKVLGPLVTTANVLMNSLKNKEGVTPEYQQNYAIIAGKMAESLQKVQELNDAIAGLSVTPEKSGGTSTNKA